MYIAISMFTPRLSPSLPPVTYKICVERVGETPNSSPGPAKWIRSAIARDADFRHLPGTYTDVLIVSA